MNSKEEIEKFKKYEADYTRRLKAKYFSDKTIFGGKKQHQLRGLVHSRNVFNIMEHVILAGNIFDEKITVDGLNIKASKYVPCY